MSIVDMMRNAMLAGFGVQEKVKEMIDDLVKKGELSESQGAKLVKEWTDKVEKNTDDIGKSLSEVVSKTLEKMNLSTKDDILKMQEKLDAVLARVAKLEETKGQG